MIRPRSRPHFRFDILVAPLLVLSSFLPLEVLGQTSDYSHFLQKVTWEAQVLGRSQSGIACWVGSPQEGLRLEVLPQRTGSEGLQQLLDQQGEGFTLVLGLGPSGTFNPWGRRWQGIGRAVGVWVRLATGILEGYEPDQLAQERGCRLLSGSSSAVASRPRFRGAEKSAASGSEIRVQLPALEQLSNLTEPSEDSGRADGPDTFRQRQVDRGRGRGGRQEILTFKELVLSQGPVWEIKSSRKPGRILISQPETWLSNEPGSEVFAPLWPLSQLLDLGPKIPGTSAGP